MVSAGNKSFLLHRFCFGGLKKTSENLKQYVDLAYGELKKKKVPCYGVVFDNENTMKKLDGDGDGKYPKYV